MPNFPRADRDGLYGCGKCGTYHRVETGGRLACGHCKTAIPLVRVGDSLAPAPERKGRREEDRPPTV